MAEMDEKRVARMAVVKVVRMAELRALL